MMAARVVKACFILTILSISIACTDGNAARPSASRRVDAVDHSNAGSELYRDYCASCHGAAARGNGPAAKALKIPPPDLTALARRNGGRFPGGQVYQVIEWGGAIASHGSREMPVWGVAFRPISDENQKLVSQRIHALTDYIEAIQLK
jgi:mono/diheme cytochrome c family protein